MGDYLPELTTDFATDQAAVSCGIGVLTYRRSKFPIGCLSFPQIRKCRHGRFTINVIARDNGMMFV